MPSTTGHQQPDRPSRRARAQARQQLHDQVGAPTQTSFRQPRLTPDTFARRWGRRALYTALVVGSLAVMLVGFSEVAGRYATAGLGPQLDHILATVPPISTEGSAVDPLAGIGTQPADPAPPAPAGASATCRTARADVVTRIDAGHAERALSEPAYEHAWYTYAHSCPAADRQALTDWTVDRMTTDQLADTSTSQPSSQPTSSHR